MAGIYRFTVREPFKIFVARFTALRNKASLTVFRQACTIATLNISRCILQDYRISIHNLLSASNMSFNKRKQNFYHRYIYNEIMEIEAILGKSNLTINGH